MHQMVSESGQLKEGPLDQSVAWPQTLTASNHFHSSLEKEASCAISSLSKIRLPTLLQHTSKQSFIVSSMFTT